MQATERRAKTPRGLVYFRTRERKNDMQRHLVCDWGDGTSIAVPWTKPVGELDGERVAEVFGCRFVRMMRSVDGEWCALVSRG